MTPELTTLLKLAKDPLEDSPLKLRAALVADTSSQFLAGALKGFARHLGYQLDLFEADFDQVDIQILIPDSALHRFRPDFVILYLSGQKLFAQHAGTKTEDQSKLASRFIERIHQIHHRLSSDGCQLIVFNVADPGAGVFGNYGTQVASSLQYQISLINIELMRMAETATDLRIFDFAALQAALGRGALFDPKLYYSSKIAIRPDATPLVARDLTQMMAAAKGKVAKCVILDLDNTLWGGVIGDDGVDRIQIGDLGIGNAFSDFQRWIKQLKERGVVLAVCSKNNEEIAREPFLTHPDMILRLDDIAVFVANWDDKATNIRRIKKIINIDYSAMVFLDDNPVERALVRESFPTMIVPDLPEDPCDYVFVLQALNLFEAGSFTVQDGARTRDYQAEVLRQKERETFVDAEGFLKSLDMRATVRPFVPFDFPRVAQLTQRSNQYNLRSFRYTEKQIEELAQSGSHKTFTFRLSDKYGDNGLVSVIILERREGEFFVDTWLMSCRVLGRGLEGFVLNTIAAAAREERLGRIVGEYLPSVKNGMVSDHYAGLGFSPLGGDQWVLELDKFSGQKVYIVEEKEPDDALVVCEIRNDE